MLAGTGEVIMVNLVTTFIVYVTFSVITAEAVCFLHNAWILLKSIVKEIVLFSVLKNIDHCYWSFELPGSLVTPP